MARAWVIHDYSGYQGLRLEEFDEEKPGPGEIRLRVEAFALNWGDMDLMHDRYSFSFPEFPARIGMEASGIVDAVGSGVTNVNVGERYCTLPHFYYNRGASAESLVIDARYVTSAPKGMTAVESASIWMQYMTAYFPIIELSDAGPGKFILVPAGTSTAGTAALELGHLKGATMIATTRFEYNREFLMDRGASHVFVQGSGNLADELQEITNGQGIHAAFDPIGAGLIGEYSPSLGRNSRIYFYGMLDAQFPDLPVVDMFRTNCLFQAYSLFNYVEDAEMCAKGTEFVHKALNDGAIAPRIDRVYPMEEYREAWDYLGAPRTTHGKVVVETGI